MSIARSKHVGVLVVLLLFAEPPVGTMNASQGNDRGKRASECYASVHQMLFPDRLQLNPFPPNVKWIVVVTVRPAYAGSETWFSLASKYNGDIELDIKTPHRASLTRQLIDLTGKLPETTCDELARMVQIDEYKIRDKDTPALRRSAESFQAIRMSPVMPDQLIMDSYNYHFWSESQWEQEMSVNLVGPGPEAPKQPHPLVEWVEEMRSVANKYVRNAKAD
jgi:hypothetical protein